MQKTTVIVGGTGKAGRRVARVLGREPRDFTDHARETAATGVWNA
ncbi:hypothetical protein [Streptosporangium sandarakinum]